MLITLISFWIIFVFISILIIQELIIEDYKTFYENMNTIVPEAYLIGMMFGAILTILTVMCFPK